LSGQYFRANVHVIPPDGVDVIEYDAERGALGATFASDNPDAGSTRDRFDGRHDIWLRVRDVPGDQSVMVQVDDRQVLRSALRVLGVPDPSPAGGTTQNRQELDGRAHLTDEELLGDVSYQLPGTRVVRLGRMDDAQTYRLTVCTTHQGGSTSCTEGNDTGRRILGSHQLRVHGVYHFGVIAGIGVSAVVPGEPVAVRDELSNHWHVESQRISPTASVPLILTWYPRGRDPLSHDWTIGLGAGLDMLAATRRFFFPSVTLAWGAFGLTAALVLDAPTGNDQIANVASGVELPDSSQAPDLGGLFGRRSMPRMGAFLGLTFDLDVFRTAFNTLFKNQLPSVGGGS
jgi:hypothetical protein